MSIGKYLTNLGVIGALMGALGTAKQAQAMPFAEHPASASIALALIRSAVAAVREVRVRNIVRYPSISELLHGRQYDGPFRTWPSSHEWRLRQRKTKRLRFFYPLRATMGLTTTGHDLSGPHPAA